MKERFGGWIKADSITRAFSALLAIAAIWMLVDVVAGRRNSLADLVFGLALGLFLGDQVRILASRRSR